MVALYGYNFFKLFKMSLLASKKLYDIQIPKEKVFITLNDALIFEKKHGRDAVINGVVGCLKREDESFFVYNVVEETYKSLLSADLFNYASFVTGHSDYKEAVKEYVFADYIDYFKNSYIAVTATAGGSGALNHAFKGYTDTGQTVLLPKYMWTPYKMMVLANELNYETYELFDGDSFNIEDFTQKVLKIAKKQGKVFVLINDPCHNPTSYSLSIEEWEAVVEVLKEAGKYGDVVLLNDIAYIDYDFRGASKAREHFKLFAGLPKNILPIIAFSASKSFTSYGLRVGAEIIISSNPHVIEEFEKLSGILCRTTWTSISRGGMEFITKIIDNETLMVRLKNERAEILEILKTRANAFVEGAKKNNLEIFPFRSGFFITVPVNKEIIEKVADDLEKKGVFVLEIEGALRVAICSIPTSKLKSLPKLMKESIEKFR
jgi:aspartate/tyrosine/aromatic aminotransferase